MPQISIFFGIIIRMYFDDHNPPHFHASYAENQAIIDIKKNELIDNWGKAIRQEKLLPIKSPP